ncbi:delta-like protein 4 isoform X5 [Moschus berezovskii]|uniref:delta-like protein 4 isoform X5 n=1 Tax=Moschus berezovskii TaxID=68408 RepID=UPI00244509F3|nr:delta-like protein 4 isoform X5 [Moschus berezovskii]
MTWSHLLGYQTGKYKSSREESSSGKAQKFQQKTLNWTLNNLREENDSTEGWKPQGSFPSSSTFQALSGNAADKGHLGAPPRPSCCKNGGTCVLSSFCVCPAHFTGRYCEHDQRRSAAPWCTEPGPSAAATSAGASSRHCTASPCRHLAAVVRRTRPASCAHSPHSGSCSFLPTDPQRSTCARRHRNERSAWIHHSGKSYSW